VSATIKADGDTWRAELGGSRPARNVVFFCESTNQRPYRVIPVGDRFGDVDDLGDLTAEELRDLFDQSGSMGAPAEYPTYGS